MIKAKTKEAKAEIKFFRISPKKIRPIIHELIGKNQADALAYVNFLPQRAGFWLKKIIKSAVANAENKGLKKDKLIVKELVCDQGTKMKRFRAGERGKAKTYTRRLSHLKIILEEKTEAASETISKKIKNKSKK